MTSNLAGLILAAGGGRRLGGVAKALLEFEGEHLVERAVRTAREGGCAEAVVVLGAQAEDVLRAADLRDCRVEVNPDWESGMGSSLRAGLAAVPDDCSAVAILLVDQPFVTADAVRAVRDAHTAGADIAVAGYAGRRAHPVLIAARHWPAVAESALGDRGARDFLAAHEAVVVPCDGSPADIDLPADLRLLA